jgi:hypothetical protein
MISVSSLSRALSLSLTLSLSLFLSLPPSLLLVRSLSLTFSLSHPLADTLYIWASADIYAIVTDAHKLRVVDTFDGVTLTAAGG